MIMTIIYINIYINNKHSYIYTLIINTIIIYRYWYIINNNKYIVLSLYITHISNSSNS